MKRLDDSVISNQVDSKTTAWTASSYVSEFMKGRANEFIIEPKKASGTPLMSFDEIQGSIHFTLSCGSLMSSSPMVHIYGTVMVVLPSTIESSLKQ
jgi:hypothetical protein